MSDEQLLVTLGVQDKGAAKQINALNKELQYLDKEFKTTSKGSKEFENTQDGLSIKLTYLEKKYETNSYKLEAYKKKLDETKSSIEKKTQELENLKNSEEENAKAIEKTEKQLSSYKEQMLSTTRNINLTEKEMENLKGEINDTSNTLSNFKVDSFKAKMKETSESIENTSKRFNDAGSKISGVGTKLTLGITAPFILAAKKSTSLASDTEENLNKVEATFRENSKSIIEWSNTTLDSYGIASGSALEYAATLGDLLKGVGFSKNEITDMSKTIIGMSADIASFKNSSPEEVFNAIQAAMTGEYEQLKKYGYVINETILQEYAHSKGIEKKVSDMSLQEKATLSLAKIQEYAKDAQGDFSKTADGNANSSRIFAESLKELGATFGKELLPAITPVIQNATELIKAFAKTDDETRKNIVRFAAFAAGTGPVLIGLGKITQATGSVIGMYGKLTKNTADVSKGTGALTKGFGLLNPTTLAVGAGIATVAGVMAVAKTNNDLMKKGISYTTDEMNGLERAVAIFNGTNFKSRKELEESGVIYKEFSKNISPEFQQKVKENTKSINDFAMRLNEINFDGVISDEESAAFVNDVNKTASDAINAIKARQEESNKAMQDMFISDGVIDESEKKVIELMNRSGETQINEVNQLKAEILVIEQKALEEKRILTEGEIKIIQDKNSRIRQIELENLAKSKEEIIYSTNEFQERIKNIDIEGAKEIVAEKAKIRDEEAAKISAGYDTQIQLMKEKLSEVTGEDRKALEDQIEIAESKKIELLNKNNELYDGYLAILNEKNPMVMENINKFNGEELVQADFKKQEMLKKLQEQYDGLNSITETGNYMMLDKTSGSLVKLSVVVDEKTGEITGIYDNFSGNVGAYSDDIAKSVIDVSKEYEAGTFTIKNALQDMGNSTVNAKGQIVNANGEVVLSLQDLQVNADGTREGVLNLNGTPINIKANTNGAISNLNDVNNAISDIPGTKSVTIKTFFESVGNGIKSLFGFADGTNYAPSGLALVAEEGQEIIEKNGRFILTGDTGPQLFNFSGGEKVYTAEETKAILANKRISGGYFSQNSLESKELANTTINNSYNNNSNSNNLDLTSLGDIISNSILKGLQGLSLNPNIVLDTGQLLGTVSNGLAMKSRGRR